MNLLRSVPLALLLLAGCSPVQLVAQENALRQGIQGRVVVLTGNHMPGPGKKRPPAAAGAIREIAVYPLTHLSQVKITGPFYAGIQTKQVAKVVSGPDGTFRVLLKPGTYSLFSQEPGGLFANRLDGTGYIFPVEVKAGQLTPVEFVIDYNASY